MFGFAGQDKINSCLEGGPNVQVLYTPQRSLILLKKTVVQAKEKPLGGIVESVVHAMYCSAHLAPGWITATRALVDASIVHERISACFKSCRITFIPVFILGHFSIFSSLIFIRFHASSLIFIRFHASI
jgi:hypothetical protein